MGFEAYGVEGKGGPSKGGPQPGLEGWVETRGNARGLMKLLILHSLGLWLYCLGLWLRLSASVFFCVGESAAAPKRHRLCCRILQYGFGRALL